MYEYGNIEEAKAGSILEFVGKTSDTVDNAFTTGELYIVAIKDPIGKDDYMYNNKGRKSSASIEIARWKLVKTKLGSEAKVGDKVICIKSYFDSRKVPHKKCEQGKIYRCDTLNSYINGYYPKDFLVLCELELVIREGTTSQNMIADLSEYNGFEVGKMVIRTTKTNTRGLKHGYKTELIKISMNYKGEVFLTVKDSNGEIRRSCRMKSWRPYIVKDELNTNLLDEVDWAKLGVFHIRDFCNEGKPRDCASFKERGEYGCVGCNAYIAIDELKAEEQDMSKKNTLEVIFNGDKVVTLLNEKGEVSKTDLEKKLPYAMVVYGADGNHEINLYNKTYKGAKKRKNKYLQRPENLGKTVTIHKEVGVFTTRIPVVEVK